MNMQSFPGSAEGGRGPSQEFPFGLTTHWCPTLSQDRVPADLSHFWVIVVISNSVRFRRRYELYWKFKAMCEAAGFGDRMITVELALSNRSHIITQPGNPRHVQLRSIEELWHKENMVNIGVQQARRLDPRIREVAWIDADCFPMTMRPYDWFAETWHQLQHFQVVQMWEHLINFGPQNQPISAPQLSFMATYHRMGCTVPEGHNRSVSNEQNYEATVKGGLYLGRPGLAWAANIDALDAIGGLPDFCILGSGDWHLAHALIGAMDDGSYTAETKLLSRYAEELLEIQTKCERWIKRDVGFVPMTVGHEFHGNKVDRGYPTRWKILTENGYDPRRDIKYDHQGLLQLETYEPRQIRLRDGCRGYFRARNEDSIDLHEA